MQGVSESGSVASLLTTYLRGGRSVRAYGAVDPAAGVQALLGVDKTSTYVSRVLGSKNAAESAAPNRAAGPEDVFSGFAGYGLGEHTFRILSVASAAEARSNGFAGTDVVRAGTLTLDVNGATYNITLTSGATLADAAGAIRASGAPIEVGTTSDGLKEYLTLKTREVGYDTAGLASDALRITESYTGAAGKPLEATVIKEATNANIVVNGVKYTRQTNTITDAIANVTLRVDNLAQASAEKAPPFLNESFSAGFAASVGDGTFSVGVKRLSTAASAQSQAFGSVFSTVRAGQLNIQVEGSTYRVPYAEGASLGDVATRIQQSGAPVDVSVVRNSDGYRLAITARRSGVPAGGAPEDVLRISEESTGASGQALDVKIITQPQNAQLTVNGTNIESRTNLVESGVPGLTLDLRNATAQPESFTGGSPSAASDAQNNVVDVANEVFRLLQDRLLTPPPAYTPTAPEIKEPSDKIKSTVDVLAAAQGDGNGAFGALDAFGSSARKTGFEVARAFDGWKWVGGISAGGGDNASAGAGGTWEPMAAFGVRAYQDYLANLDSTPAP